VLHLQSVGNFWNEAFFDATKPRTYRPGLDKALGLGYNKHIKKGAAASG